jgi:hypothetical protein
MRKRWDAAVSHRGVTKVRTTTMTTVGFPDTLTYARIVPGGHTIRPCCQRRPKIDPFSTVEN